MTKHELTTPKIRDLVRCSERTVGYWKSGEVDMSYTAWFTLRTKVEGKPPKEKK